MPTFDLGPCPLAIKENNYKLKPFLNIYNIADFSLFLFANAMNTFKKIGAVNQ